jgi:hypothetical protein
MVDLNAGSLYPRERAYMILSWFPIKRPMNESMRTKAWKKGRVA